jgi:hypothetical protein
LTDSVRLEIDPSPPSCPVPPPFRSSAATVLPLPEEEVVLETIEKGRSPRNRWDWEVGAGYSVAECDEFGKHAVIAVFMLEAASEMDRLLIRPHWTA